MAIVHVVAVNGEEVVSYRQDKIATIRSHNPYALMGFRRFTANRVARTSTDPMRRRMDRKHAPSTENRRHSFPQPLRVDGVSTLHGRVARTSTNPMRRLVRGRVLQPDERRSLSL